jgi:hypothetical protein
MTERKIYRAGMRMIDAFGDNAVRATGLRCDKCLEDADMDCFVRWKRIMRAVEELLAGGSGTVH